MRCYLGRGVTVERRIATAVWNQEERERIIALRAHDVFCSRGCEHGFDVAVRLPPRLTQTVKTQLTVR